MYKNYDQFNKWGQPKMQSLHCEPELQEHENGTMNLTGRLTEAFNSALELFSSLFQIGRMVTPDIIQIPYAPEYRRYRIGDVYFSDGNPYHLRIINRHYHTQLRERVWLHSDHHVQELMQSIRDGNAQGAILGYLRAHYANEYSGSSEPPCDDLPTAIAEELAQIYYLNLEITLEDVKQVFRKHFPTSQALAEVTPAFLSRIKHAKIDKGRMQLRMLLPVPNILEIALRAVSPNIFERLFQSFRSFLNNLSGSSGSNSPIDRYKQVIAKTLDKYISSWKLSWFGHHHDQRARYLKQEILNTNSVIAIQGLLLRQCELINPENYCDEYAWDDGNILTPFKDETVNRKWNYPEGVVHRSQPTAKSGFFKVLKESLDVDPNNPIYIPDQNSWW